jgi:hypothetical protein
MLRRPMIHQPTSTIITTTLETIFSSKLNFKTILEPTQNQHIIRVGIYIQEKLKKNV